MPLSLSPLTGDNTGMSGEVMTSPMAERQLTNGVLALISPPAVPQYEFAPPGSACA
jgi:hypothetical protein